MTKKLETSLNKKSKKSDQKKQSSVTQQLNDYRRLKRINTMIINSLLILLIIGCAIFLIRIKTHVVSGHSMEPTFTDKDQIFVVKGKRPTRYDIVTFSPRDKPKDSYVKRVVGQPGDSIWLEENKLFINHQLKEKSSAPSDDTDKRAIDLPDGTIKVDISVDVMNQLKGLSKIPKDNYFLLGDNRNHSTDSRMLGLVSEDQIEGVVSFRYYPLNKIGYVR